MKHILLYTFLTITSCAAQAQLNLQWQNLGPDNMGGEVRGLIIDNRDPTRQTLYAGVIGGGVWKSTNGAAAWNYLGCPGNYAISCIAQGADGTIYMGTGEGIIAVLGDNTSETHPGNGIYKLDSLDNFIHFNATTPANALSCWRAVNRIAVNPNNPNQLIAANVCGLYQSTDGGNTWNVITIPGVANTESLDVKWSTDGTKILAALGGPLSREEIIRSTDFGNTWSEISVNPGFPTAALGRIEIAFAPSNSNVAYLSIATGSISQDGCTYGVIKTLDGGNTWDTVALRGVDFDPFGPGCQGWYDNAIAVSPLDSSKIYVGGLNMYSYSPQTGVHQLTPFADTYFYNEVYNGEFLYVINDQNPDEMYVASQSGVFKSTNANTNFTTAQFSASNTGMAARDFMSVAASRNGRVTGGSLNQDALLMSNSGSQNFSGVSQGIGNCYFSQLDTTYAFIEEFFGALYVSNNGLTTFVTAFDTSIDPQGVDVPSRCGPSSEGDYISPYLLFETKSAFATEDSVAFTSTVELPAGEVVNVTSQTANTAFPYTLTAALQAGDTLMVPDPVQSKLFFSTNCGLWMKRHALELTTTPEWYQIWDSIYNPTCFAVTKNGNTIYFGFSGGELVRLSGLNFGNYNTYKMVDSFPSQTINFPELYISGVAVDPANDSALLVAGDAYSSSDSTNVYISKNAGQTWTAVQIGPAGMPAYTCVIDANNSNNYIVGTEHGIWTSNDAGLTWQQDDDGMCDVPVYQLRQIPLLTDDCYVLYAATNSRGLWRSVTLTPPGCNTSSAINTPLNDSPDGDFRLYPNPASSYTTVEFSITEPQQVTIRIFDIAGRLIQTSEKFFPAGDEKAELNTSTLPAGTYLVNVEAGQIQKTRLLVISE